MSTFPDPDLTASRGKKADTREQILREAVTAAREIGISGLSIGTLAERVGMSKSGLFAHFGSKEDLQIAVLDAAQSGFVDHVMRPACQEPRGLPRLRAITKRWLHWSGGGPDLKGGCVVLAAFHEFDDRPGPVRDALRLISQSLHSTLMRTARQTIDTGDLPPDTDAEQLSFELFGIIMSSHLHTRLAADPDAQNRALAALERLIAYPPIQKPVSHSSPS
jgi:AcrR family transcriptional regulator